MKAIQCHAYGPIDDLVYEDIAAPSPGENDVIIEPQSIGVNFPDALLVQGLYQAKPPTPFTPGMEVVGKIKAIGKKVEGFAIGDRVAAISQFGAWAEQVKCDTGTIMRIPNGADGDEIVALLCGYGTAHHALKQRASLKKGETLVVTGASGLTGLGAVQIGKAMGARVIAIASNKQKQQLALDAGADLALGYDNLKDELKQATGGRGVDVAFEVIGGDIFDACSRAMGWGGRLLVVGFASGIIPKFPVNLSLVKGYSVVGVFWGSFTARQPALYAANMEELMQWYENGIIRPHIGKAFKLADAVSALHYILERKATGKIVLNP